MIRILTRGRGYAHKKLPTLATEWVTRDYLDTSITSLAMFTSRLSIAMTKLHLVEVLLSLLAHLRFLLVLGVATLHHLTFWRRLRYKEIPSYSLPLTDIILYGSTTNYKNPLVRYFWWHISLLSKRRRWRMFPSASSLRAKRSNLGGGDNHEIASLCSQ